MPPTTKYIVLVSYGASWEKAGTYEAYSSESAVRQAALASLKGDVTTGVFVAIPERSFSPTSVTAKVETTLKFGEQS